MGTVGKGKKVIVLDVEGGSVTYSSPTYLADPNATEPENIDVLSFPTEGPDAPATARDLAHRVESVFDYLIRSNNADGYELVVIDSLTEFQKRFIYMYDAADLRQAYGALSDAVYSIVLKARQAPVHTVFITRPKAAIDEVTGKEIVRSDVAPSVWSVISGLMDAVGYYHAKSQGIGAQARTVRVLDFTHDNRFQAKQRYGLGEMQEPTMAQLLEVIRQKEVPQVEKKPVTVRQPRRIGNGTTTRPATTN